MSNNRCQRSDDESFDRAVHQILKEIAAELNLPLADLDDPRVKLALVLPPISYATYKAALYRLN